MRDSDQDIIIKSLANDLHRLLGDKYQLTCCGYPLHCVISHESNIKRDIVRRDIGYFCTLSLVNESPSHIKITSHLDSAIKLTYELADPNQFNIISIAKQIRKLYKHVESLKSN
jgi:hypothetical protein